MTFFYQTKNQQKVAPDGSNAVNQQLSSLKIVSDGNKHLHEVFTQFIFAAEKLTNQNVKR